MSAPQSDSEGATHSGLSEATTFSLIAFPEQDPRYAKTDSESESEYTKGGYHAVQIGDTFNNKRYRVLQKLGWGHFSTVWLCHDYLHNTHCALKIQKSNPSYTEAARDEIMLLEALNQQRSSGDVYVLELIDQFDHRGENGMHVCLVFEMLGKSLLSFIKSFNYNGAPYPLVKIIAKQILHGLAFIHEKCKMVHTDLKPENVLFVPSKDEMDRLGIQAQKAAKTFEVSEAEKSPISKERAGEIGKIYVPNSENAFASGRVKIVDFGNACLEKTPFTDDVQTRQYRSPEVILNMGYDREADIWSLACILFELLTGEFLFDPKPGKRFDRDEDHVAQMISLLGAVPPEMIRKGKNSKKLFSSKRPGQLRNIRPTDSWRLTACLAKRGLTADEAKEFESFLLPMLRYDPEKRISALAALKHPCMKFLKATTDASTSADAQER